MIVKGEIIMITRKGVGVLCAYLVIFALVVGVFYLIESASPLYWLFFIPLVGVGTALLMWVDGWRYDNVI